MFTMKLPGSIDYQTACLPIDTYITWMALKVKVKYSPVRRTCYAGTSLCVTTGCCSPEYLTQHAQKQYYEAAILQSCSLSMILQNLTTMVSATLSKNIPNWGKYSGIAATSEVIAGMSGILMIRKSASSCSPIRSARKQGHTVKK